MRDWVGFAVFLGILIVILALGLIFSDKGIEREGKVIGTYTSNGDTRCIVLVDNVRYDDYCKNIEGDIVKITIYDNGQGSIP